jgi:hypothetical protein
MSFFTAGCRHGMLRRCAASTLHPLHFYGPFLNVAAHPRSQDVVFVQTGVHDLVGSIEDYVNNTQFLMEELRGQKQWFIRTVSAIHTLSSYREVSERGMRFPRVKQFYEKMFEIAHHAGRPSLACFMSTAAMRESPLDGYHYMNFGAGPLHYSGNEVEMGCTAQALNMILDKWGGINHDEFH